MGGQVKTYQVARAQARRLVRFLKGHGWNVVRASDGELSERVKNEREAIAVVDSVDESVLHFMRANEPRSGQVMLIPSNGREVISDYGGPPNFLSLVDEFIDAQ